MLNKKQKAIIDFVLANQPVKRDAIHKGVKVKMGDSTIRRLLLKMTPELIKASDYKKAMLLFYEQNNLTEFKKIFMSQYEYAVNKYFNLEPEVTE